jgi:hypothetical protein
MDTRNAQNFDSYMNCFSYSSSSQGRHFTRRPSTREAETPATFTETCNNFSHNNEKNVGLFNMSVVSNVKWKVYQQCLHVL